MNVQFSNFAKVEFYLTESAFYPVAWIGHWDTIRKMNYLCNNNQQDALFSLNFFFNNHLRRCTINTACCIGVYSKIPPDDEYLICSKHIVDD